VRRSWSFSAVLYFFSSDATSGLRLVGQSCPSTCTSPCQRATIRATLPDRAAAATHSGWLPNLLKFQTVI
jgi:hypothetical protein